MDEKTAVAFEKYTRDGKVAVLISPGYGAGWYSWNREHEGLLFDADIVQAILEGDYRRAESVAEAKYGEEVYTGGASSLTVVWLSPGTAFDIEEYDGHESFRFADSPWRVA